jgi:hypothetical protein
MITSPQDLLRIVQLVGLRPSLSPYNYTSVRSAYSARPFSTSLSASPFMIPWISKHQILLAYRTSIVTITILIIKVLTGFSHKVIFPTKSRT